MSDSTHSTLGTFDKELENLVTNGFPPIEGPSDQQIRDSARDLAVAVAYTWLNGDTSAQDAFLDQIIALNREGAGIMFAVDLFAQSRLLGVKPGEFASDRDLAITTHWLHKITPAEADHHRESLNLITDLWTGIAVGDTARSGRARAELYELPPRQIRDILRIMAYDMSILMDTVADWQGAGSELWQRYREANPPAGAISQFMAGQS